MMGSFYISSSITYKYVFKASSDEGVTSTRTKRDILMEESPLVQDINNGGK